MSGRALSKQDNEGMDTLEAPQNMQSVHNQDVVGREKGLEMVSQVLASSGCRNVVCFDDENNFRVLGVHCLLL